ncbi:hypothetical protein Taro_035395 [Colocasia esculenta]|uniref:Uncharacterized protein n=1 Tax=Colocasia esculenta TaxID=4460 RepID=A0A843W6J2_COLES|nr:hypothetical protein [Colocasia esculenta]
MMSRSPSASLHQRRRRPGCRNLVSCHDKLVVAACFPDVTCVLSRWSSPSRWYRDGLGGRDKTWSASGVFVASIGVSACASG